MNTELITQAKLAKEASVSLALATTDEKNRALGLIADALIEKSDVILAANKLDIDAATAKGTGSAMIDRLTLTEARIADIAEGVRQVASLPDPVGEVIESFERPNGLKIRKVRVPLGVIGMIYEARPNVTVDAAVLALKAGSAVLLRGSGSALNSNLAIVKVMRKALAKTAIPEDAIALVGGVSHDVVDEMMSLRGYIDLMIPRGGAGLIRRVVDGCRVPVLETGVGNCHIYVDKYADAQMAEKILINAKTQRPAVCNAAETLLVHADRRDTALALCESLKAAGVTVHGCPEICKIFPEAIPAEEVDYTDEYLSLHMAVKIVENEDEAIAHIRRYGTGHTEAIITDCPDAAEKFTRQVDASSVNVNASTRFTDGFQFGFGAEIGISTQKMHARGPLGLREITSFKFIVEGTGQIRS
ncbi:MAG: glutamate-5-semialdehyde dehydrogenase [Clostridia bacterium]|nr:glutamate-5-semialdehyde dehydrogenase [Clostridia bacterium]MBR5448143.1 glutamate-5-semialdehyde dehydrogenase [Clostridia bacterium]